jgi:8-oxo-dGTP pyrophosphatase MutT (NUDIX family)
MSRQPLPTWFFVLVVVRLQDRFLVVQERKHGQLWYLPAGRVEPGEDLVAAAHRETLEEAGIRIRLEGILRVEHTPNLNGQCRMRVVFLASPIGSLEPKRVPDQESLGAAWVTLAELASFPLRGEEVRVLFEYVAAGATASPMSLLTAEGAPYVFS